MLGKAAPKFGDRVDELVSNIQKKLYGQEGGGRVRDENRIEGLAYVFDLRFDLDAWVHAQGEVLDRPTHARVDLRREDDLSVTHVSSLGFVTTDGVPFSEIQKRKHNFVAPTTTIFI